MTEEAILNPQDEAPEQVTDIEPTNDISKILNIMEINESVLDHASLATGIFITGKGVHLRAHRPNPSLMQKAMEQFKAPDVPEVYDKDMETDVENPDDPDYVKAVAKYEQDVLMLISDIYTSHVDIYKLPDEIEPPEGTQWQEDAELFGITVPERGRARLLAWLNYYIMDEDEYKAFVAFMFMYNNRIKEESVRNSIDSFRSSQGQPATVPVPDKG